MNSISINKIGKVAELKNQISKCDRDLRQFSLDFNELYFLSNTLLSPLKNISTTINKITIIKDENILTIPFDVLLLSKPQEFFQNNLYLIKKYDISYSYSVSLLLRNSPQISTNDNFNFVGFAPTDFVKNLERPLDPLSGSVDEVVNISRLFAKIKPPSLTLIGPDASIENFYIYSNKANILHVATHSSKNNSTSNVGLLLNPTSNGLYNLLTYFDILNLTASPNLIVLASCFSYSGKLIEGEGIQNIGRAFSIKGASFVISSLFRLDDEFSKRFTTDFYKKLLESKDIKKSLCETKREFITDTKYSYPSYWSNYNIIGK